MIHERCTIPSGRNLRKRSLALICLTFRGLCATLYVSSSVGESVLFISESWVTSHRTSMVHIS
jgi:hypothetical protein